jgi:16S rRNA (guanine527-N7)-methyltransferase
VDTHVADSLTGLLEAVRAGERIVDIGSGAGFPGLVLAIAVPDARFDLLEASRRKAGFIQHAVASLGLDNATVVNARAEEWAAGEGRERYGMALARAVGSLPVLVEYAAPLLRVGGSLIAWKGRRDQREEAQAGQAATRIGMKPARVLSVDPFPTARDRHIHVFVKEFPSPAGYPRRPGMARKHPLGQP